VITDTATTPAVEAASRIIRGQKKVVGDAAYKLASRVHGLNVHKDGTVTLQGDEIEILDQLVREYSAITGPIGARICYMAAAPILRQNPDLKIPALAAFG
jgi:hypothetical protein